MRYLAAFVFVSLVSSTSAFAAAPEKLIERVQREGVSTIVSRPETLRDRDLDYLDLIASVMNDTNGAQAVARARELRGMPPVNSRGILPGIEENLANALRTRANTYQIIFGNESGQVADEIVVFYRTKRTLSTGLPAMPVKVLGLPSGSAHRFELGECSQLVDYVIGVFEGNQLVTKIPAQGNMTPAMAASINRGDTDPCVDHWHLAVDFLPVPGSR